MTSIGETTALIPQAGSSEKPEHLQDGGSGDTDFPFGTFKALATVGEIDPATGEALTGYPDGHAGWLVDENTIRVAYQSESYATLSSSEGETYGWVMDSGAVFTGSHIHTIDYDREGFADFLNNDLPASDMFKGSGKLFYTVYNVFGEEVTGKNNDPNDLGAKWGNQAQVDENGNVILVEFDSDQLLTEGDFFFHSFCGAYYEQANKYGDGIGFEDDIYLMGEEWNIGELFDEAAADAGFTEEEARLSPGEDFFTTTMGLASMVVDIANETAYTVPALGQSGYEKLLPMNSGHEDYVVLVAAGYNLEVEPAPLMIYIGKKGVDEKGDPLAPDASERDSFLGRNGLLYGQLYGMALDADTYAALGIEVDADTKMMDAYAKDADAPNTLSARYYPTSYQWGGFDNPVNADETEVFLWEQDGDDGEGNEQPGGGVESGGYTYFNGDSKTEHPAVDPDITKHRYVQNLTIPQAQLGIDFTDIVNELENNDADGNGLPDYLSADVTRIIAGVPGSLTLETGGKGAAHVGEENPDGTLTHGIHVESGEPWMQDPDGLQWIKTSDGDYLIVDEDSGNDYGERKYVLSIDGETLQLKEEGKGYFLASAGGFLNPRAIAEVAAIPETFTRATSSEFSGTWNVSHLVATKKDGSFYTQEEIAGTGAQEIISSLPLAEQTFIGVVQHRGESSGIIADRKADQGGQIFMFNIELPVPEPTPPNQPAQMEGLNGYGVTPIFTIGQVFEDGSQGDYFPPGILDGLGAYTLEDGNTIRVLANHELRNNQGYAYTLANGTELTGARVSFFDIDKNTLELVDVGLAYHTIINRQGKVVEDSSDLEFGGIERLCSAQYIEAYQFGNGMGLHDGIFFTGEETYGGTEFVVDVATNTMYAVPWMGRAAWESVTEINTGDTEKVALLVGDDRQAAPLLLYLGTKGDANGDGTVDFLERNGLASGELYVWVADSGEITPEEFNGTGADRDGTFVKIVHYDLAQAGSAVDTDGDGSIQDELGYDEQGFATQAQQDFLAAEAGAFQFSRPEDVATNPFNDTEIVMASTGRGGLFPSDNWGTTYGIDVEFGGEITANIRIFYDGDDAGNGQFEGPDFGLRSPDNLDWADDGMIYVQEDRSTSPSSLFGGTSGKEASIWKLNPDSGILTRVAEMDRSAVPEGQTDSDPDDIGDWESSGIIDVSTLFEQAPGTRFIFDVQAHSLRDGIIEYENLVQGGQLAFLTVQPELVGYAELPADTFEEGPPSGSALDNPTNGRETPFPSQPVQGFSGVQFATKESYWFLSDNGFGNKGNSADYLLRIYKVDPDFVGTEEGDGSVEVQDFIQLSDPNNLIPFEIVNEDTSDRLLTGADFDIESFVIADDGTIWIGDEFGPFLLHFNNEGVLIDEPISTPNITNLNTLNGQDPLVIAHRGASGELPEHTLEAYQLGIEQGADFIEPDLVSTKDGVLIARHEPNIIDTTDIKDKIDELAQNNPELETIYPNLQPITKIVDGGEQTGYFAEDFTLAEIKQLRAVQSRDYRDQSFNGLYEIPTLEEIIDLVQQVETQTGQQIGIYPETKHPTYFDQQGLSLEEKLVEELVEQGFTDPDRLFLQSFEIENLIDLQGLLDAEGLGDIPLVQLYDEVSASPYDVVYNANQGNDLSLIYGDLVNLVDGGLTSETVYGDLEPPEVLQWMSDNYAEGVGPWKNNFLLREPLDEAVDGDGDGVAEITSQLTGEVTPFVEDAHNAGLQLHTYTMRDEERFLTLNPDGTPQTAEEEYEQLIEIGVDGFFTDFPDTAVSVVELITADYVSSPDNPSLENSEDANLARSRGFEGMAFSPDGKTLYPMLEGTVKGDPEGSLRIYEFDLATESYSDELAGYYQMEAPNHAIGDFTPINDNEFLVIERDGGQGDTANFKKIFKIDISKLDENGFVEKEMVVDLLNIADPNDLNGDGSLVFDFPFVTIEDVLVIDEETILVANDNNYPFSIGRPETGDIDNNEIIQIKLPTPLDLDDRLGVDNAPEEVTPPPKVVYGTRGDDYFDSAFPDDKQFVGKEQILFTGSGDDTVDVSQMGAGNRIDTRTGDDMIFVGTNNSVIAGAGDDIIFAGSGEGGNNISTGADFDQVWLIEDIGAIPENINQVSDFDPDFDVIGFANSGLTMEDKGILWNYEQVGNNVMISTFGREIGMLLNTSVTDANFVLA